MSDDLLRDMLAKLQPGMDQEKVFAAILDDTLAAEGANAAEAFVALHQAQSPINTAVNAHIHATLPNFLIQECFDDFLPDWIWDIVQGVPRVKDGYIEVSDAPGIGVDFDEAEI
jgi:L-alanine-DL-glutamate epimerase-like enolase superfamily enzyme